MYIFNESELENIVVHQVGNKLQEEGFVISKKPVKLDEPLIKDLLLKYFLAPFKKEAVFNFHHDTDLNLNEIFNYCDKIFEAPDSFYIQSVNITKHLYDCSTHHNIKSGDFYIAYFSGCEINGEYTDAIGLFKSENKDTFIKVYQQAESFEIGHDYGVNINKLDKGCLIFNLKKETGYTVCIIDNTNKSNEAQYWKDDFLKIKPFEDNFYHTKNFMHLCKDFCNDVLNKNNEVSKPDQIDILNKSINYFAKNEAFNIREFESDVMEASDLIEVFQDYKQNHQEKNNYKVYDEFDISENAVKGNKKFLKSILKLDKNFHVYIHGNKEYIEKGYDEERALNYYKLFFKDEA